MQEHTNALSELEHSGGDHPDSPPLQIVAKLNASDRCDRDGAQAIYRAVHTVTDTELLLCAHHTHEHGRQLQAKGFIIYDAKGAIAPSDAVDHLVEVIK